MDIEQLAAGKPALPHSAIRDVLGLRVRFTSNDSTVLAHIASAFAPAREGAASPVSEVHVYVDHEASPAEPVQPPDAHVHGDLLELSGKHVRAFGNKSARMAAAIVSTHFAADSRALQRDIVDTLALWTINAADRHPLHAAAIRRGDTALLIAGPSGTGKSTLAFAALNAGYDVLSDDYVHVQLQPRLRVWALRRPLHLLPDARAFYPQLAAMQPIRAAKGKQKLEIALTRPDTDQLPLVIDRVGLCILERRDSHAAMPERITPEHAAEILSRDLEQGFDVFRQTMAECIRRVAAGGAWRVYSAQHPDETLARIAPLFDDVRPVN